MIDDNFEDEDWVADKVPASINNTSERLFKWLGLLGAIGLFSIAMLIAAE